MLTGCSKQDELRSVRGREIERQPRNHEVPSSICFMKCLKHDQPPLVCSLSCCRSRDGAHGDVFVMQAEPHSSAGSVADLRTGGRWFDPRLGQYSFRGLMTVIATGFFPLSPLSVVSTMVMWESSQWLGNNIVWSTG